MGVATHQGGAGNGGTGEYLGIYCLPPEHGHTIHYNSYYHGLVSGSGAEPRECAYLVMVGADRIRYLGDKGGACSRVEGGETGME